MPPWGTCRDNHYYSSTTLNSGVQMSYAVFSAWNLSTTVDIPAKFQHDGLYFSPLILHSSLRYFTFTGYIPLWDSSDPVRWEGNLFTPMCLFPFARHLSCIWCNCSSYTLQDLLVYTSKMLQSKHCAKRPVQERERKWKQACRMMYQLYRCRYSSIFSESVLQVFCLRRASQTGIQLKLLPHPCNRGRKLDAPHRGKQEQ